MQQNKMQYEIIPAQLEHLPQLQEIEEQCFSDPLPLETLRSYISAEHHECFVIIYKEQILGYAGLLYVLDEGHVANIAVRGEYRGMGLGDALLQYMMQQCRERKLAYILLEVRVSNLPAISLYEKYGFLSVGRRRDYYTTPKEDAILMTKILL